MRSALLAVAMLASAFCSAQEPCYGDVGLYSPLGPCLKVAVPRFEVRIRVMGARDTAWYAVPGDAVDSVWARTANAWIQPADSATCERDLITRYVPCDPSDPEVAERFLLFANEDRNAVIEVDWREVVEIRFRNLRMLHLPPNYERIAYLSATDANGLRILPDGRWRMPGGAYCQQEPAPAEWLKPGVIAQASIRLPSPTDFRYFLSKSSNGAALRFSAELIEIVVAGKE